MMFLNHRYSSYLLLVVTIFGALSSGGSLQTSTISGASPSEAVVAVNVTEWTTGAAVEVPGATASAAAEAEVEPAEGAKRPRRKRESAKKGKKKKNTGSKETEGNKRNKKGASKSTTSGWKTTGVTFYGQTPGDDNGVGITGVDLFKHGKAGIRFNGEVVYPAAVYQGDAAQYLYKVLEVTSTDFKRSKRVYLHIVDACNSGQHICRKNVSRYGRFLVDVHETATGVLGVDDGLLKGSFRVVGAIQASELPVKVWRNDVVLCGCRKHCRGDGEMTWRALSDCPR